MVKKGGGCRGPQGPTLQDHNSDDVELTKENARELERESGESDQMDEELWWFVNVQPLELPRRDEEPGSTTALGTPHLHLHHVHHRQ